MSANGTVPRRRVREAHVDRDRHRARARLDDLHVAAARRRARAWSRSSTSVGERPVLEPFLVEAEDAREPARRRLDDAVARQEHRDRRRVLHERAEPRDLVAGDLPSPALGQVAHAEHEVVAERRADHLDEAPTVGAADAQLERRADFLGLHARERERRELEVVGVDEVEAVAADRLVDRDAEQPLGGAVGPADLGAGVDDQHRVGQGLRDGGEGRELALAAAAASSGHVGAVSPGESIVRVHRPGIGAH